MDFPGAKSHTARRSKGIQTGLTLSDCDTSEMTTKEEALLQSPDEMGRPGV